MNVWPTRRLGDLVDVLSGFAFASERFADSGDLPVVRIRDVMSGASSTFYRGDIDQKYVVRNGDVLIGMDGEFNRARWRGGEALLNQRVCRIKSVSQQLDEAYLFHFLPEALKAIERVTPFVTVKHLSAGQIRDIEIPLPPLADQRRIAEVLDLAEALRAKRGAALRVLAALSQSLFLDMFGDPVSNPKMWPNPTLGRLLTFQQYGPRFFNESYSADGIRIVRITDLSHAGYLDFASMPRLSVSDDDREKYSLRPGDVIFARSGATVGKVALIQPDDPPCIAGAYFITMRFAEALDPVYACAVLSSPSIRSIVERQSRQAAQQNFSGPGLRQLPMPCPPIELQREFANVVKVLTKLDASQTASRAQLDNLFGSLQHCAFRGGL